MIKLLTEKEHTEETRGTRKQGCIEFESKADILMLKHTFSLFGLKDYIELEIDGNCVYMKCYIEDDSYITELSAIKTELKQILNRIEMIERNIESDKRNKQSVYNFKQFADAYMKNKEAQYADQ